MAPPNRPSERETDPARAQRWDPARYAEHGRFVADLAGPLVALLAPRPDDDILDLGCGDGALTASIAPRCRRIVGVDASPEQVQAARALGLDARVADGHALPFDSEFDAIVTNAALHWMTRPDDAIDGMWRALRPGGRIAGEMGGAGNVAAISKALVDALGRRGIDGESRFPWYFPTPGAYRRKLAARGLEVTEMALVERPTTLPGDISGWLETFAEPFLGAVAADRRPAMIAEVRDALEPVLYRPGTGWVADYVRLRFLAVKPRAAEG